MKNNSKVGTGLRLLLTYLILAAAVVNPSRSHAVNTEDSVMRSANESAVGGHQIGGANNADAVNLLFTGLTQAGAVATTTGAYVTISATAMTFYQPFATLDTSVGTAGVITYASTLGSNTMGSLCDYLHSLGAKYKCTLISAQRDDPPVILRTQTSTDGTNNLAATSQRPLKGGFSVDQATTTFVSLGIIPAAGRRVVLKQCTFNGFKGSGNDNGFQIYGQLRKYGTANSGGAPAASATDQFGTAVNDSYLVWRSSHVAATDTTLPSSNALPRWLEFAEDAHVVVRTGNIASDSVQTSANFVRCSWDER